MRRLANSGYSGPIPDTFGLLSSLTTLSLENNNLTGRIPPGLSRLKRMYHLNLSKNGLDGVVPFDAAFLRRLGRNLEPGDVAQLGRQRDAAHGVVLQDQVLQVAEAGEAGGEAAAQLVVAERRYSMNR